MATLDRRVAGLVGRALAGEDAGGDGVGAPPPVDLIGVCDAAAARIADYARMTPAEELPSPEWIGRGTWIDLNVETLVPVIEPGLSRAGDTLGPASGVAGAAIGTLAGAEAGVVTGLLAGRVLGQVEPGLLRGPDRPPTRLVLVAPNLRKAAGAMSVDEVDLVRWVCAHEMTHAVQFASVTWLRPELERHITDLVTRLEVGVDLRSVLRLPSLDDLGEFVRRVREGDILRAVASADALARLDRVQALMTLVEGHAEHVMDEVGADDVDDIPALRRAMTARREERGTLDTVIARLLGIDAKLRQYGEGRTFCDAVVEAGGRKALRTAWDSPESAPSMDEIREPQRWLDRVA